MYKKIFLFIALFITAQLSAQYSDYQISRPDLSTLNLEQIRFGLKISPNIAWMGVIHDDMEADGATLKFGIGITADYELNSLFSIISGINYNSIGGYVFDSNSLNDNITKSNYKLNYTQIEIPLGLKFQTPPVHKVSYYLQGGLASGFILSANEKHKSTISNTNISPLDTKEVTTEFSQSYFLGIGTQYYITSKLKVYAEINYKNAYKNLAKGDNYMTDGIHDYSTPLELKPASMDFSFGIQF